MTKRNSGCWFILLSLPSAFVHAIRQTAWQNSFPQPHEIHTAKEAMDIANMLMSDHGGTGAAFPYVQRALEFDPLNVNANKFMAHRFVDSGKFAEALPFLRIAVLGAHPDSVYVLMLRQTLAALGEHTEAGDA